MRASYYVSSANQMQMESRLDVVLVDSEYHVPCCLAARADSSCCAPRSLLQKSFVAEKPLAGGPRRPRPLMLRAGGGEGMAECHAAGGRRGRFVNLESGKVTGSCHEFAPATTGCGMALFVPAVCRQQWSDAARAVTAWGGSAGACRCHG